MYVYYTHTYIFEKVWEDYLQTRAAKRTDFRVWNSMKACEVTGRTGAQQEGVRIWAGSLRLS